MFIRDSLSQVCGWSPWQKIYLLRFSGWYLVTGKLSTQVSQWYECEAADWKVNRFYHKLQVIADDVIMMLKNDDNNVGSDVLSAYLFVCIYVCLYIGNGCDDSLQIFRVAAGHPRDSFSCKLFWRVMGRKPENLTAPTGQAQGEWAVGPGLSLRRHCCRPGPGRQWCWRPDSIFSSVEWGRWGMGQDLK